MPDTAVGWYPRRVLEERMPRAVAPRRVILLLVLAVLTGLLGMHALSTSH